MKREICALAYDHEHFKMSEALAHKLEAKLDDINLQGDFYAYFNSAGHFGAIKGEGQYVRLSTYPMFNDDILARSVCKAIKNWYSMCINHRLFVVNKFNGYCSQSKLINIFFSKSDYTLAFCDFFIKEFTSILNDDQCKTISEYW